MTSTCVTTCGFDRWRERQGVKQTVNSKQKRARTGSASGGPTQRAIAVCSLENRCVTPHADVTAGTASTKKIQRASCTHSAARPNHMECCSTPSRPDSVRVIDCDAPFPAGHTAHGASQYTSLRTRNATHHSRHLRGTYRGRQAPALWFDKNVTLSLTLNTVLRLCTNVRFCRPSSHPVCRPTSRMKRNVHQQLSTFRTTIATY